MLKPLPFLLRMELHVLTKAQQPFFPAIHTWKIAPYPFICVYVRRRERNRGRESKREREEESKCMYLLIHVFHYFNISFSVQPPNSNPPRFSSSPLHPLPLCRIPLSPSLSLSLSLFYSISLKARYGVLLRMAARYCSIVAGWRTLSALVISSHEGSLITAAQRASLHPHRPFSYPRCRPNIPASKIHTSQTP